MAMAGRLGANDLVDLLKADARDRLSMIFLLSGVDKGGELPAIRNPLSLASLMLHDLGCDNDTVLDFAFIPKDHVYERLRILRIPTGVAPAAPPPAAAHAEGAAEGADAGGDQPEVDEGALPPNVPNRLLKGAEMGKCLMAWDFAIELTKVMTTPKESPVALAAEKVPQPAPLASKTVKLNGFISQEMEGTAQLMSPAEVKKVQDVYKTRLGILPNEAAAPSNEQLAALKHVLDNDIVAYVDFALWGPYNKRFMKRKTNLVSYAPDIDSGNWRPSHRLTGPPAFDIWLSSWRVFRTAMIMLEGADPERLDQYSDFIRNLHEKHGTKCWWLIYQADIRMRSEKIEKFMEQLSDSNITDLTGSEKHKWNIPFTISIDLEQPGVAEFWNEQVHRPAQEFKSGQSTQNELTRDGSKQYLAQNEGTEKETYSKRQRRERSVAANLRWQKEQRDNAQWEIPWNVWKPDKWKGKGKGKDDGWQADWWKGNGKGKRGNKDGKKGGKGKDGKRGPKGGKAATATPAVTAATAPAGG
jgi:hypothetical protein